MNDLTNKTALVTGGGTGIGFGCARRLAEHGAKVLLVGRREDILQDAVNRMKELVPQAAISCMVADATDETQLAAAVAAAAEGGRLDIMVANAGSAVPGPILEMDADGWRATSDMNITSTAMSIKHAARAMRDYGSGGSIVTVSSTAGAQPEKWMAAYSATKAAVEMLTRCAALELAPFDIRVNCIQPGYVLTEATEFFHPDFARRLIDDTPLKRAAQPEEIGDALLYLVSHGGRWVTGQILGVDGGLNIPRGADFSEMISQMYGEEVMAACSGPQD